MKHLSGRILTLVLVLLAAISLLPMGTLAATVGVFQEHYDTSAPLWKDAFQSPAYMQTRMGPMVTIKTSDYSDLITIGNEKYDLEGIYEYDIHKKPFEKIEPHSTLTFRGPGHHIVCLAYVPHEHEEVSRWAYDTTTHWRYCLKCEANFLYQNWHYDLDENKVCDICGTEIVYYKITILDNEGGTVTTDVTTAPYRDRIDVTAVADSGYCLKEVRFFKVRPDGSRQRIMGYLDGADYYCSMPTYDMEIEAEFIKNG